MKRRLLTILCVMALLLGAFGVAAAAVDANTAAVIGETPYVSLQAAIDAVNQGTQVGLIQLKKAADAVTVNGDVYVDLNGFDIASVDVKSGTFYGADSQTDDYAIDAQNHTGYGKILAKKGAVKGAPVEADFTDDSYLMVEETDIGTSFHCVNLRLTDMTLRPESVGLYFKSNFGGDALVAQQVAKFGVALSVKGEPTRENLKTDCQLSSFTGFEAGANDDATSTLLEGVMKEKNAKIVNSRNAAMPVYGKAYVLLHNGEYIFGKAQVRTLHEQVTELSKDADKVTDKVVDMYVTYKAVMRPWTDIEGVKDAFLKEEDKIFRILNISNSHGQDSVWQLPTVFNAEEPNFKYMVAECYFSGALTEHVQNATENAPVYVYWTRTDSDALWNETRNVPISYALEQEHWDVVMFNESSRHLGLESIMSKGLIDWFIDYLDYNLDYEPKLYYNMTWSNPTDERFHAKNSGRQKAPDTFKNSYTKDYGFDHINHYNKLVELTKKYLVNDDRFEKIIYNAKPVQYAQEVFGVPQWDDNQVMDLYRDYTHLSDFARLMVAYNLYARIFEIDELTAVNTDLVQWQTRAPWNNRHEKLGDLTITPEHKNIILESVNETLKDPFTIPEN